MSPYERTCGDPVTPPPNSIFRNCQEVQGTSWLACTSPSAALIDRTTGDAKWSSRYAQFHCGNSLLVDVGDGRLHSLDKATGQHKWTSDCAPEQGGARWSSDFLEADDRIFFQTDEGVCVVRASNGDVLWKRASDVRWLALSQGTLAYVVGDDNWSGIGAQVRRRSVGRIAAGLSR